MLAKIMSAFRKFFKKNKTQKKQNMQKNNIESKKHSATTKTKTPEEEFVKKMKQVAAYYGITDKNQIAYIYATVRWETAGTFMPVKEAYWLSENWRAKHLWYYPFYGRGFVQLSLRKNYEVLGDLLGVDLVGNMDLALDYDISMKILVVGMKDGLFTGKRLSDYIKTGKVDFKEARRIINGRDRAAEIAGLADEYLKSDFVA